MSELQENSTNMSSQNNYMNNHRNQKRYTSLSKLVFLTLTYNLSSFYFGYSMVYFNAVPYSQIKNMIGLDQDKSWDALAEGILTGCIPFGALFGSLISMKIIKNFSRRQCFYIGNILAIFSGILCLIGTWYSLMVSRIIQGFCVGFFSTLTPMMVKQMAPVQISGSLGAFVSPSIGFGFLLAYFLPYYFKEILSWKLQYFWKFTFNFTIITASAQMFLLYKIFPYQSPKYLILSGKLQQMKKVISYFYRQQYWLEVQNQKIKDLNQVHLNSQHPQPCNQSLKEYNDTHQNNIQDDNISEKQFSVQSTLYNHKPHQLPKNIPLAVIYAFCLPFFQQLSGINVVVTFASQIVSQSLPELQEQMPLLINSQKLIFAIISIFLLQKFGRKQLMMIGTFFVCVSLFLLYFSISFSGEGNTSYKKLIIFSFFLFISSFVPSMGPITWLYMPEIVQPNILPLTVATHWIMACGIVTLFPIIRKHSSNPGCPELFLFFGTCTLIFFFVTKYLMIQTKNKKQYEIRQAYQIKWEQAKELFDN